MNTKILGAVAVAVMSINLAVAAPQDAVNQIRQNAADVMTILSKANGSNDAAVRRQAENYAMPYFDFTRMTALAVGPAWRSANPQQQTNLTQQFKTLLIRTYSGTMLKFKNAKVDVKSTPVVRNNGSVIVVHTAVTPAGSKPVNMDYTVYASGSKYRIYDVSVEGRSLVTVYRNDFGNTIRQKGVDGLIADLKAKNSR